eukprot:TRINITY_DN1527_c0_g1_i12.p1 TRINITY_DN1527_c0_g1~~TRINITY_DN1527_c0_g1_i12.p1  ORF type:complete len:452 (-),score=109.58 TRINITY_DN1527_c0_g1_i12:197-1552(-)
MRSSSIRASAINYSETDEERGDRRNSNNSDFDSDPDDAAPFSIHGDQHHRKDSSLVPLLNPSNTKRGRHNSIFVKSFEDFKGQEDWEVQRKKYVYILGDSFESFFFKFDRLITSGVQYKRFKLLGYLAMSVTNIFAIEIGFALPFILFATGWDGFGLELAYLMLFLSLFSQIPKRFLWRYRPYMVKRAYKMNPKESAKTSSFPSRAVTCATVYSFFACYVYVHMFIANPMTGKDTHHNNSVEYSIGPYYILWWMPVLITVCVLLSSWARIILGVHYPSDCLFGFLQGAAVCAVATFVHHLHAVGLGVWCQTCFDNMCYANAEHAVNLKSLGSINWFVFASCLIVSLVLVLFSIIKPIDFWDKCDRVYGMLLPGIVFHLTFLCPQISTVSLEQPGKEHWWSYISATVLVCLCSFLVYRNRGKFGMLSFILLFCILYFYLVVWRSSHVGEIKS